MSDKCQMSTLYVRGGKFCKCTRRGRYTFRDGQRLCFIHASQRLIRSAVDEGRIRDNRRY